MVFCPSPKKSGPETELECCWQMEFAFLTMEDQAPIAVPTMTGRLGTSKRMIWNLGPSSPSRMVQWYTTSADWSIVSSSCNDGSRVHEGRQL